MKTTIIAIALSTWSLDLARAETVEMTTGPDLSVNYDPAVWKPLSPLRGPEPGTFQSMTWKFQGAVQAHITVVSHPEQKKDADFKREMLIEQKFRGDPAELVRERRASLSGRDWLVLDFRNASTQPPRGEVHYFLPTDDGYITLCLIGDAAHLQRYNSAIAMFLGKIQLN